MTWHAAPESIADWIAGNGSENSAAAVEAHLMGCANCRALVRSLQEESDLRPVWTRVADAIESPAPNVLTRAMRLVGVSEPDSLVLRAAPAYTAAWAVAVGVVVALTFFASTINPDRMLMFYLLFAPLVPIAGIAAASDPRQTPPTRCPWPLPTPRSGSCCCEAHRCCSDRSP